MRGRLVTVLPAALLRSSEHSHTLQVAQKPLGVRAPAPSRPRPGPGPAGPGAQAGRLGGRAGEAARAPWSPASPAQALLVPRFRFLLSEGPAREGGDGGAGGLRPPGLCPSKCIARPPCPPCGAGAQSCSAAAAGPRAPGAAAWPGEDRHPPPLSPVRSPPAPPPPSSPRRACGPARPLLWHLPLCTAWLLGPRPALAARSGR